MKKLIKLSDIHYVITDDSEIKIGDWMIELLNKVIIQVKVEGNDYSNSTFKKITHSTPIGRLSAMLKAGVKEISLSEVEEAIYGYNVDKMALEKDIKNNAEDWIYNQLSESPSEDISFCAEACEDFWKAGFKAYQELIKDKLYNIEQVFDAIGLAIGLWSPTYASFEQGWKDKIIQYLLPKTEWNIEIIDNKIVIL